MPYSIYMPRAVAYSGSSNTSTSPTGDGNMPVEHCFNLGDLSSYLLARGLNESEVAEEIEENYKLTTEPDGTRWYCGSSVSMYRPKVFDITRGKYTGGKVKVTKGRLQFAGGFDNGTAYYVAIPTQIKATDKDNKVLDWLEVRSELQPISGVQVQQQLTKESLLKDKYVWISVVAFVLIMFYLLRK